jgi:Rieske 2Fe-2S family protein
MDDAYVRAVMRFFVHLYRKGYIYRANRIINWCPFHLTSLSDLEVQHVDVDDTLSYVRYPLADLRTARRIVYDVRANWKVIVENYNECYHCAGVHPELCRIVPAFREKGGAYLDWVNGVPQAEGTFTFTLTGTTDHAPFPGLDAHEQTRHKGELAYPNLMVSLSADHVAAFTLVPKAPDRTLVVVDWLFHPDEMAKPGFDPSDAVDFWDLVNRQDWAVCEGVQDGMTSRRFESGWYAPMEDLSLDIRRYLAERLGEPAIGPHVAIEGGHEDAVHPELAW